ncbi:hypothetical protein PHYPSEUDO_009495 [Phytophthora pseudosyringae]|uniref:Uncharacterized protein n=1 Tax=Phytophthora pseudosyringae TaxID=221518 RepID=A0A8T1VF88_9STRA|nr:hypothetical protein PHYPSEUDO_009495 [Phytophthora pseudosyringae]
MERRKRAYSVLQFSTFFLALVVAHQGRVVRGPPQRPEWIVPSQDEDMAPVTGSEGARAYDAPTREGYDSYLYAGGYMYTYGIGPSTGFAGSSLACGRTCRHASGVAVQSWRLAGWSGPGQERLPLTLRQERDVCYCGARPFQRPPSQSDKSSLLQENRFQTQHSPCPSVTSKQNAFRQAYGALRGSTAARDDRVHHPLGLIFLAMTPNDAANRLMHTEAYQFWMIVEREPFVEWFSVHGFAFFNAGYMTVLVKLFMFRSIIKRANRGVIPKSWYVVVAEWCKLQLPVGCRSGWI